MIVDLETDALRVAKHVIYNSIPTDNWANIHNIFEVLLEATNFSLDDLTFAYWSLLGEGSIWGDSPVVWRSGPKELTTAREPYQYAFTTSGSYFK